MKGMKGISVLTPVLLFTLAINPFALFPDSATVTIRNNLSDASIIAVHYLVSGSGRITGSALPSPVPPGGSVDISLPCRSFARLILRTDSGVNYRKPQFHPAPSGDTLTISRADREFGGYFDVIMGERPFVIQNSTPVAMRAIYLEGDFMPVESVIGANPLMTDEVLFLWFDPDSVTIVAVDLEGNFSKPIGMIRTDCVNTFSIGIEAFLEETFHPPPEVLWIINGINGESITGIEVYPRSEEPFFLDLSDDPLRLWQTAVIPFSGEVDYVVCFDSRNRAFFIDSRDESTGAFLADWWHLEFDFSFPEGRNR